MLFQSLSHWCERYRIPCPAEDRADQLENFLSLLMKWNRRINLTADGDRETLIHRHLMDSLAPLALAGVISGTLLDVGSGGGFPGIPLAICRPDVEFILAERVARKCAFLRAVKRELKLSRLTVMEADIRRLVPRPDWMTAVTRAVRVDRELIDQLKLLGVRRLVAFEAVADEHTAFRYRLPGEHRDRFLSLVRLQD